MKKYLVLLFILTYFCATQSMDNPNDLSGTIDNAKNVLNSMRVKIRARNIRARNIGLTGFAAGIILNNVWWCWHKDMRINQKDNRNIILPEVEAFVRDKLHQWEPGDEKVAAVSIKGTRKDTPSVFMNTLFVPEDSLKQFVECKKNPNVDVQYVHDRSSLFVRDDSTIELYPAEDMSWRRTTLQEIDDMWAGIFGHEYAHIKNRDSERYLIAKVSVAGAMLALGNPLYKAANRINDFVPRFLTKVSIAWACLVCYRVFTSLYKKYREYKADQYVIEHANNSGVLHGLAKFMLIGYPEFDINDIDWQKSITVTWDGIAYDKDKKNIDVLLRIELENFHSRHPHPFIRAYYFQQAAMELEHKQRDE